MTGSAPSSRRNGKVPEAVPITGLPPVVPAGTRCSGCFSRESPPAPASATPLEAIAHALDVAGQKLFVPARRDFVSRRRAVVAASAELQEREALKGLALLASITEAFRQRGVADMTAQVAAQMGALALKLAFERWLDPDNEAEFGQVARRTLAELQTATAACGSRA